MKNFNFETSSKNSKLRKVEWLASKTFDKKEFSRTMKPVVKNLNKSPLRQRMNSGDQKTDFFHMAKGILKSSKISLKKSSDKTPNYHSNKSSKIACVQINFTPSQSTMRGSTNYEKYEEEQIKNYISSNSSTIRLVTDSEWSTVTLG